MTPAQGGSSPQCSRDRGSSPRRLLEASVGCLATGNMTLYSKVLLRGWTSGQIVAIVYGGAVWIGVRVLGDCLWPVLVCGCVCVALWF